MAKQWIDWKYHNQERPRKADEDDLVFTIYKSKTPNGLYFKLLVEFQKLLAIVGLDKRKEGGVQKRRKITLHSFRRFVKTVISDQTNQEYSEWFLGHSKSPYYTKKENERRQLYTTKCMKYLTFLDYTTIEVTGKNIEAKLSEKEKEIQLLRQRDSINTDAIAGLSDQLAKVMQEIEVLKRRATTRATNSNKQDYSPQLDANSPRQQTTNECLTILQAAKSLTFEDLVRQACQQNPHIATYIGDKYLTKTNVKLRPVLQKLLENSNVKRVNHKPIVLSYI